MGKPTKKEYSMVTVPSHKPGDYRVHEVVEYNFKKNKEVKHYIVQKFIEREDVILTEFLFIFSTFKRVKTHIWAAVNETTENGLSLFHPRRFGRKQDAQKYINYLTKHGK